MFVLKLNYTIILCVFTVKSLVKMPIINDTSLKSINYCGNYSLRNVQLQEHRNNLTVKVTLKSDKVSVHTFKNNNQKLQRAITIAMTNNKKQQ